MDTKVLKVKLMISFAVTNVLKVKLMKNEWTVLIEGPLKLLGYHIALMFGGLLGSLI